MSEGACITAVCVVHEIRPDPFGPEPYTAIDKRAVSGRVEVGPLGVSGDTQCDRLHHGGIYQAVYAYADEDAAWWARELDREVPPGLFGDNVRTRGVDVTGAEIGERWRIGDGNGALVVEVTSPRIPCRTFAGRMGEERWIKRFTDHGAPGAYLRVIEPGDIAAGDPVEVVHRPGHGITVGDVFLRAEPRVMRRLLDVAYSDSLDLSPALRSYAVKVAAQNDRSA